MIDGRTIATCSHRFEPVPNIIRPSPKRSTATYQLWDFMGLITDDKATLDPYNNVAFLEGELPSGTTRQCTAFFVTKYVALTAAHCVYNKDGGDWISHLRLYPGQTLAFWDRGRLVRPYPSVVATRAEVPSEWFTASSSDDVRYDIAALFLESHSLGQSGVALSAELASDEYVLEILGYPGKYREEYTNSMMNAIGRVDDITDETIQMRTITGPGMSGGPVFVQYCPPANAVCTLDKVVGVLTQGVMDLEISYATRLKPHWALLREWMAYEPPTPDPLEPANPHLPGHPMCGSGTALVLVGFVPFAQLARRRMPRCKRE